MFIRSSEKKGIVVLICLIFILFVLPKAMKSNEQPFFILPKAEWPDTTIPPTPVLPQVSTIELNTADSVTLVRLKGIGPYYAQKILRYREQLGGFYSPKQLKELSYKYLDIDSLLPLFTADTRHIRKKELDTMSFKNILRHPYLEYEDVQLIFNAKRKFGYISFDSLKTHGVLSTHKLKRIKPYFK